MLQASEEPSIAAIGHSWFIRPLLWLRHDLQNDVLCPEISLKHLLLVGTDEDLGTFVMNKIPVLKETKPVRTTDLRITAARELCAMRHIKISVVPPFLAPAVAIHDLKVGDVRENNRPETTLRPFSAACKHL